jgi:hypothetical protein
VGKVVGSVVEAGMNAIDEVKEETDDEAEALAKEEEAEARWKKKGKGKKGPNKKVEQPVKKVASLRFGGNGCRRLVFGQTEATSGKGLRYPCRYARSSLGSLRRGE